MGKKILIFTGVVIGLFIMVFVMRNILCLKITAEWNEFTESEEYLLNRECGFYNMRGVKISDDLPLKNDVYEEIENEKNNLTLELLQIHIGAYKDSYISDSGLLQIKKVFDAYLKRNDVDLIVRVLYDWDGKGMEAEPDNIELVLAHMEQFGNIFKEYEKIIYIVQGIFVGSWAEMHNSRYLTDNYYQTLIEKMDEVVPKSIFLAVRTPAYWRNATKRMEPLEMEEALQRITLESRLSLFNDGILGNILDCGTYGDIKREEAQLFSDKWVREDELEFQKQLNLYVPNGGEVVLENPLNDLSEADSIFRKMHLSYLNKDHDTEVLEKWKSSLYMGDEQLYAGMTDYEYVQRHLGYRFVIRDVNIKRNGWMRQNLSLSVEIENVGYANRYTECSVEILLKSTVTEKTLLFIPDTDVRKWNAGTKINVTVDCDIVQGEEYEVFLKVSGKKNKENILFANKNICTEDGACFLGKIKKGN